jgi:hypothetical protein
VADATPIPAETKKTASKNKEATTVRRVITVRPPFETRRISSRARQLTRGGNLVANSMELTLGFTPACAGRPSRHQHPPQTTGMEGRAFRRTVNHRQPSWPRGTKLQFTRSVTGRPSAVTASRHRTSQRSVRTGPNASSSVHPAHLMTAAKSHEPQRPQCPNPHVLYGFRYSMRRPEMLRLMTSRWISEVPSKIVKIFESRCQRSTGYSRV